MSHGVLLLLLLRILALAIIGQQVAQIVVIIRRHGVPELIKGSNVRKRYWTLVQISPPPLFVDEEHSKLTGRVQRGLRGSCAVQGAKWAQFLKLFGWPSASYAHQVVANRVPPDSLSRNLLGKYSNFSLIPLPWGVTTWAETILLNWIGGLSFVGCEKNWNNWRSLLHLCDRGNTVKK